MLLTAGKFGLKASEIFVLPAKDIYVALFMVSCLQQSDTLAKITDVYHGLSWLHQSLGMKHPCESTLVMNLVEACRRELGKPKLRKNVFLLNIYLHLLKILDTEKHL